MKYGKILNGLNGYQVSNKGRVNGMKGIMTPNVTKKGYLTVNIKGKTTLIHRLVAEAFIPNPENKPQVNHKNTRKVDNRVENLEWTTNKENMQHSWKMGLREHMYTKVFQYDLQGNFIKEWDSIKEIEQQLNIRHSSIWACCNGKYKTAGKIARTTILLYGTPT